MKGKGQFSFDFLIAVLIFIAAAQIIISMTGAFEESQKQVAAQNQLRAISETAASKISQSTLLSKDSTISFQAPLIMLAGQKPQDCNITVSDTEDARIEVSVSLEVKYEGDVQASKLDCEQIGKRPAARVYFDGISTSYLDLNFELLDSGILQKRAGFFPAGNYASVTIDFPTDCWITANGSNHGTNLQIRGVSIGGKNFPFPLSNASEGDPNGLILGPGDRGPDGHGKIVFPLALRSCSGLGNDCSAPSAKSCPGDWLASNDSARCCSMPCSTSGEVQAEFIPAEGISGTASSSSPLESSSLIAGNFSFTCGRTVDCAVANAGKVSCADGGS